MRKVGSGLKGGAAVCLAYRREYPRMEDESKVFFGLAARDERLRRNFFL
jgi:hypothetical protein